MMTALVVDDEPLARRKLTGLLRGLPDVECVGEAADGRTALTLVAEREPQVILLDVAMPEMDGLEVVRRLSVTANPPVPIFTTAYDEYAVRAFECQALDYLLKPFGAARLAGALDRVRALLDVRTRLAALERAVDALDRCAAERPLERLFVREGTSVKCVAVEAISRISGEDDYAALHSNGRVHLVGLRLGELEQRLPQSAFLRVHRSHIVNVAHMSCIRRLDEARLEVVMKDGTLVPVSRARARDIRRLAR